MLIKAQFFTYDNLKLTLSSLLSESDLNVLLEYFKISEDSLIDTNYGSSKEKDKYANFLQILEEKGILHREDFHQVKEAFCHLGSHHSRMVMSFVDFYQEYAEKAILPSSTQASIDAEGGHRLQLNDFSAEYWSVVDMSLGPGPHEMVVLSGYNEDSGETSLDCIHKKDSDATFPWLRKREFDKGSSKKSKRFVCFINESQIVTCCHNIAEVINLNTNESKYKACLPMTESASCVTVRNKNIYFGFENSVDILVLNENLQEKMKIKLKDNESMWPIDLAVSIGRLFVCVGNMSSSKVFLFAEVDGKKLLEYRIDVDKAQAPLSVAIHEESDLVAILWNTKNEDEEYYEIDWSYPEDRTYGYLSLHSLSQGYCLSVVSVGLSVCHFDCECYEGCSSGKKVRISSGCVAVLDTMSGVKFFDMKKMFTSDSVKTALCQFITSDDCQELMCSNKETAGTSDQNKDEFNHSDTQNNEDNGQNNCSKIGNEDDGQDEDKETESSIESESDNSLEDEDIRLSPGGMHIADIILAVLKDKKHMKSDDFSVLKHEISHTICRHNASSVKQVAPEWNIEPFVRFKETFWRNPLEVFVGPCDKIVTVKGEEDACKVMACFYSWDENNHTQPTLMYFREFNGVDSKLLISCLDKNKAVTLCNDVIEVADFNLNGKITNSLDLTEYGGIVTCMTTKDEEIYAGFKSSEVVIFDSDLEEKWTITIDLMDGEWPKDMSVSAERLFLCTGGSFSRALSFCKYGRKLTEYKYLPEKCKNPCSITVDEHHDLIGILWGTSVQDNHEGEVTLHSLSKGHCLALLDTNSTIRFSFKNGLTRIHELHGKFYLLDQNLLFEGWKNFMASKVKTIGECEKLQQFFQICYNEVISKAESMIGTHRKPQVKVQRMRGLMKVLEEKGVISPEGVHNLKRATETLTAAYTKELCEPLDAFIQFPKKSTHHVALTLLDLQKSAAGIEHFNTNDFLVNTNTSQIPALRNTFDRFQDKRPHNEPDHSVSGMEMSGKRARTDAVHSGGSVCMEEVYVRRELTVSERQVDSLPDQLMEEDIPTYPSSVPCESSVPSVRSPQGPSSVGITMGRVTTVFADPSAINITGPLLVSTEVAGPSTCTSSLMVASSPLPVGPSVGAGSSSVEPSVLESSGDRKLSITTTPSLASARQALYPFDTPSTLSESTTFHRIPTAVEASPHNSNVSVYPMTGLPIQVLLAGLPGISNRMEREVPPLTYQNRQNTPTQSIAQVEDHSNVTQAPQMIPIPPQMMQYVGCSFETNNRSHRSQNVQTCTTQSGGLPIVQHSQQHARQSHTQQETQQTLQFMGPGERQPAVESIVQNAAQNENSVGLRVGQPPSNSLAQQTDLSQGYTFDPSILHQEGQGQQGRNEQLRQVDNPSVHQNVQPVVQKQGSNVLQQEGLGMECKTRQCEPLASDLASRQNETHTYRKECETYVTLNQRFSKELKTAIESCVHNVVSPLLKDINNTLEHLLGSSNTRCRQEDIPGTSSQSDNGSDATSRARDSPDSGHDQEVRSAWESLSEYNRMSLQAFRGMTDDRAELVRRLVEMVFTEEERRNQNCFGKSGKQKLDGNKLRKIRHITFYLCPIITKKTNIEKFSLEDVEWKRLCEVIDKANRHFREKLKRQGRGR